MILPQIEVIKAIDWSHISLKSEEEGTLCQCEKSVLFRTKAKAPHQIIILQCPECGRKLIYE